MTYLVSGWQGRNLCVLMQWRTLQNDLVENYKKELPAKLKVFDDFLGGKQFSAGDNVSIILFT